MTETATACIVFGCVFSGAVIGMLLRKVLPAEHLKDESKDVMKLGMGLLATMTALVLGLLIASAKGQYDAQRDGLDQISAKFILLDAGLAQYGPETSRARELVRQTVASAVNRIWPLDAPGSSSLIAADMTVNGRALYDEVQQLSPKSEMQRRIQSQALQLVQDLGQTRWLLAAQRESRSVPFPFLVILVFWLAVLFASFGLLSSPNATVVGVLVVCAFSVSGAVFLVLELGQPFQGLLQVSSAPMRQALGIIGH